MSARMVILEVVAVLAGAVVGTLVAGFVAWLFAGVPFVEALFSPRDYVLALVVVTIFAVLYAKLPATPAVLASLAIGTLLPMIVDRFAFGWNPGFAALLVVEVAFALAALSAYRFVHANALVREATDRAAPR